MLRTPFSFKDGRAAENVLLIDQAATPAWTVFLADQHGKGPETTGHILRGTKKREELRHRVGFLILNLASSRPVEFFPVPASLQELALDRAWRPESLPSLPSCDVRIRPHLVIDVAVGLTVEGSLGLPVSPGDGSKPPSHDHLQKHEGLVPATHRFMLLILHTPCRYEQNFEIYNSLQNNKLQTSPTITARGVTPDLSIFFIPKSLAPQVTQ